MEDGIKVRVQRIILAIAWKIKAIKRRHQLKALNKRFDEVKESRDLWRRKAAEKQDETLKLKNEILILKKEIEILAKKSLETGKPPKRYFYGINLIQVLVTCKLTTSSGLRALENTFFY